MTEAFQKLLRLTAPQDVQTELAQAFANLESGNFQAVLQDDILQGILNKIRQIDSEEPSHDEWYQVLSQQVSHLCRTDGDSPANGPLLTWRLLIMADAALQAFLQSNVTGPILPFQSAKTVLGESIAGDARRLVSLRKDFIRSLSVDGESAYTLAPNIELYGVARAIVTCPELQQEEQVLPWLRLRVHFVHQRLLSDPAPSLQRIIFDNIRVVDQILEKARDTHTDNNLVAAFALEKVAIRLHHGRDKEARLDLANAAATRKFPYVLTGRLGKKTKYQRKDISQLVVLAKSHGDDTTSNGSPADANGPLAAESAAGIAPQQPKALDLDDDTLLEKIAFAQPTDEETPHQDDIPLPAELANLDPAEQPRLDALDSIILLDEAATITNTNPADGITREETKPYAIRVIEGGSSNWQVYTQALLLRSRIEGYSSRTVERGLLQLQAVVDQVVADTASLNSQDSNGEKVAASFLPKAKEDETAPASERLLYIYQLGSPFRWDLEAELASRWVSLGGLRSALDIYERLEMWPEAALCLASTDREGKAKRVVRRQLFHSTKGAEFDADVDQDSEEWTGQERTPPPGDAPRLYCILGDINEDISMYEKAWSVSGERYSRAQRSLGRHYWSARDLGKAAEAYQLSLAVKPIDHGAWFAYGCCLLELSEFAKAVGAFSRSVQMDDTDAESWSNLATALLHLPPDAVIDGFNDDFTPAQALQSVTLADDETPSADQAPPATDPQKHTRDALQALRQATKHSPTKFKILSNLLTVAASLTPPSWPDILTAQSRLIDLRGKSQGENCVDVQIFNALVDHVINLTPGESYDATKPGLARMVVKLADEKITPLITTSRALWLVIAKLFRFRDRPASALATHEKAWRIITQKPGWEVSGKAEEWEAVVTATVGLVRAYEELGPRETTEGLAAGSGELVARDWKFKARSAVRSVKGKAKGQWEGSEGWNRLDEVMEGLKG